MAQSGTFVGIDLGTTNTLVALVTVDLKGQLTSPRCFEIDQQIDEIGNHERREILPSAVHITDSHQCVVGSYAHDRKTNGQTDVITWWKNHIGRPDEPNWAWIIEHKKWSPVQAATAVLKHIKEQFEQRYKNIPLRPVVTIPASFPESMKEATQQAIEQAGYEEALLLYEPVAALIAYLSEYEATELILPPEQRTVDLKPGQQIVVFDMGGGTVDVTLVELQAATLPNVPNQKLGARVKGYAPHTLLGGYRFDEALAKAIVTRFQQAYKLDSLPESAWNNLYYQALSWAERAKMHLARGEPEVSRNFRIPTELQLNEAHWPCLITQADYAQAVKPLLGEAMTIDSNLAPIGSKAIGEADNIIEPVVRLLQQQKQLPTNITAVLLVGGMSYLPLIRERLQQFFGEQTHLLWQHMDPMKAIAYGAAQHNAQVRNGLSPHAALVRSVSLRFYSRSTKQRELLQLIPEGTTLAYGQAAYQHTSDLLYFEAGKREVSLHLNHGGVWLRDLRFTLPSEINLRGEIPFQVMVEVDSNTHILKLKATLCDFPDIAVEKIFDETPTPSPTPPTLPLIPAGAPDPEPATRLQVNSPLLIRQLANLGPNQGAAARSMRTQLEKSAELGHYVAEIENVIKHGTPMGQQHASLLLRTIYTRYTFHDQLNPRTPAAIAQNVKDKQQSLIMVLENQISNMTLHPQTRAQAAIALGFVGLWSTDYAVDIPKLLDKLGSVRTHSNLKVEIAHAVGRTLCELKHWEALLKIWQGGLPPGPAAAILWAISRGVTRYPHFISQIQPATLASTVQRILSQGTQHGNIHIEMSAWRAIAMLSITADIGLDKPAYATQDPNLLRRIRLNLHDLPNRQRSNRPATTQEQVIRSTEYLKQALSGKTIIAQVVRKLEPDLPIGD